ncbi:hypothetical protein [Streptomyces sp. 4F14]|uniref:hypothetical protein n=1 Tax=Streptomyces sp. 4F14 TaxID=3394380 RepID=UPI003A87F26E
MRRVAYLFGGAAAAGAAVYLVVYLYRWQWQRAVLCGVLLLVVEVMLLGLVLLGRFAKLEERIRDGERRQDDVLARLRERGGEVRRFRWLDEAETGERTHVFVPVLMVTGVLLSGLAWVVQRIASATVRGPAEKRLAGRLAVLAAPDAGPTAYAPGAEEASYAAGSGHGVYASDGERGAYAVGAGAGPYAVGAEREPHPPNAGTYAAGAERDAHAAGTEPGAYEPDAERDPYAAGTGHGVDVPGGGRDSYAPAGAEQGVYVSAHGRVSYSPVRETSPPVVDLEDLPPLGAGRSRARAVRFGAVTAVGGLLLGALVVGLADLTQTRDEKADQNEATSVLMRVDTRGTTMTAQRRALAARQVWEGCRDSTSVPLDHATLGSLGDDLFAGVVRPALSEHDRMRLRGCLEDAALDRTHLTVLGIGETDADDD